MNNQRRQRTLSSTILILLLLIISSKGIVSIYSFLRKMMQTEPNQHSVQEPMDWEYTQANKNNTFNYNQQYYQHQR